jgi:hypothetical protein
LSESEHKFMGGSDQNLSPAARELRIKKLAVLDWANTPTSVIKGEFEEFANVGYQCLTTYRSTELYKETWDELRKAWDEEMLRLPQTSELKKKISHGMALSLNVLINILGGKSAAKDKISAARLMAQLDGRFLREGEDKDGTNGDSVAQELLKVMKQQSIQ